MNDKTLTAYVIAVVISIAFLLLAALVSSLIKFETGVNRTDKKKRRVWFWLFAFLTPVATFLVGFLAIAPSITVPTMHSKFMTALSIGTAIGFVLYVVLGFVMSKIFKNGKIGQWFYTATNGLECTHSKLILFVCFTLLVLV